MPWLHGKSMKAGGWELRFGSQVACTFYDVSESFPCTGIAEL